MATSKKYDFTVEQDDAQWVAKITRKVTSKKTLVTKEQDGFKSAEEAQAWAEKTLAELAQTLKISNDRHGTQRKNSEEVRRLRSARRAEKTEQAKLAKQAEEEAAEAQENESE